MQSIEIVKFEHHLNCGHRNIYTAPNITDIIRYYFLKA